MMFNLRRKVSSTPLRIPVIWFRHLGITQHDWFIASYPRSGSTWLRFLLYQALTGDRGEFASVQVAIPGIASLAVAPRIIHSTGRLIATHEMYRREYRNAIFLIRNVKDVLLSYYAFQTESYGIELGLDEFLERFLNGKVDGFGSWKGHALSWKKAKDRNIANVHVVRYEDLRRSPVPTLAGILDFMDISYKVEALERVVKDNSLERMKNAEKQGKEMGLFHAAKEEHEFIRSGTVGGWKGELNPTQIERIDRANSSVLSMFGYTGIEI